MRKIAILLFAMLMSCTFAQAQVPVQHQIPLICPAEDSDATSMTQKTITGISQWTLEVYNTITAEKKCGVNVGGSSCSIPTVGWNPGIYSVRATIGGAVLYEKILIK